MTPFSFIFLFFYFLSIFSVVSISDFFSLWLIIELAILFFLGFCYTTFSVGFSNLIIYFLIQTVASFSLFLFFCLKLITLFVVSLFLKLAIFPFHFWFVSVVYKFTNFAFFLSSTVHKVPPFIIISLHYNESIQFFLLFSSVLTLLVSGLAIFSRSDFRILLLNSSIGNNSWLILRSFLSGRFFIVFLFVYSLRLFFIFVSWGSLISSRLASNKTILFLLLSLSGLPPFPFFFIKLFLIFSVSLVLDSFFLFIFLLRRITLLVGYFRFIINYFFFTYSFSLYS